MSRLAVGYVLYLTIAVAVTVFVGRTLYRHGRVFITECFPGQPELVDAVNRLLLVGFYLLNLSLVLLTLRERVSLPHNLAIATFLTDKLGRMLLVLGGMHFLNVAVLSIFRTRARNTPAELTAFLD